MTTPRRARRPNQREQPVTPPAEIVEEPVIEERKEVTTMTTGTRIPFDQMTEDQKRNAYQDWLKRQDSRKVQNVAKRNAMNQLKANHEQEYNQLLEAARKSAAAGGGNNTGMDEDDE